MSENFQTAASGGKPPNMERNIVIRNLPHTLNENLRGKVTGLLQDGLKLAEVVVDNVERKESRVESVPGVVVVTLASKEDKVNILRVKANLSRNHRYKRVFIHPDMSKRERQLAANFRKVVNAVQNSDVKLFVKGSRVCSSKWSSADDSTPTHDNSHSHGRNFRGSKEHTTFSEMNTRKWIHMPPIHGRQVIEKMLTIDNTHRSYSQMEIIETIKVATGLKRKCPPVVVAHLSMAGHLMENIQWIEEGLRATVGVLQVIGMGMVVGAPPLVVSPVTGHLAGTNLTIIAKIILMAGPRSK